MSAAAMQRAARHAVTSSTPPACQPCARPIARPFTPAPTARRVANLSLQRARAAPRIAEVATVQSAAALTTLLLAPYALAADVAPVLGDIAAFDAQTAGLLALVLRPALSLGTILYVVRIVMSWYPQIDGTQLPWALCYYPTEPFLKATRKVVPLVGGVDVTPIVWVAILSFLSEILLGPQGILNLIQRQGGL